METYEPKYREKVDVIRLVYEKMKGPSHGIFINEARRGQVQGDHLSGGDSDACRGGGVCGSPGSYDR